LCRDCCFLTSLFKATENYDINKNSERILVGKPEAKRPLGRSRRKRMNNIKIDLREVGRGGMDWVDLA
jgi:hypothetical protein